MRSAAIRKMSVAEDLRFKFQLPRQELADPDRTLRAGNNGSVRGFWPALNGSHSRIPAQSVTPQRGARSSRRRMSAAR
jgi:hypothetical protein